MPDNTMPPSPLCYRRAAYGWQLSYHVRQCPACQDYLRHMTQFAATTTHPELGAEEVANA